jgi:MFS family permease
MTSLAPTPMMVAAVQAAATLPMFALVLPAGALADVVEKRRVLLGAQMWMMGVAGTLALLAWLDSLTAGSLLLLTGLLAVGGALTAPAWQALLPEVVPAEDLPGAVTLGGLSINIARATGPALGGFIVAATGPAAAFLLNALSFGGVVWVLGRWRRRRGPESGLPAERFLGALRAGLRYVRHAPRLKAVLVRSGAFSVFGSALWALLPLLARSELGLDASGYGMLLGVFGAGAVVGSTQLSRLRKSLEFDALVVRASLLFAVVLGTMALVPASRPALALGAMLVGGAAWLLLLSSFHVAAQTILPAWVRARALSSYLLVFFGSMTVGSLAWGAVASFSGLRPALVIAAAGAGLSTLLRGRYPLRGGEDLDLSPSRHWPLPNVAADVAEDQGLALVSIEYRVDPENEADFRVAMERVRRARQRDGAYFWELFRDTADAESYLEVFLSDSWLEHVRQHERVTEEDRSRELLARHLVRGGRPVAVRHLVSARSLGARR